jgi:HAD superfamily hydrolase (TIGR01457 family)
VERLIELYDAFIIDLDGVIYLLDDPIPGSAEAVRELSASGKKFVLLTNNATPTIQQYLEKLARFGIEVSPEQIMTSAQGVHQYLKNNYETQGKTAFVIGGEGLLSEVARLGLRLLGDEEAGEADFVLVGWDLRFDFQKLKSAAMGIRNGAIYIAANTDATYPTPKGLWPGAGSLVAAVSTAGGREPVVVGKPSPLIVVAALERMGADPGDTLLIGDRLDTDIAAGLAAGVDTLLVLTGISSEKEVEQMGIRPTYIRKNLAGLLD